MASDPTVRAGAAGSAIDSLGVLSEDSRRRMFTFVRRARRAVTRDEAAAGVGISRKLAAFHLDKLVDAGLLRAHYETPERGPTVRERLLEQYGYEPVRETATRLRLRNCPFQPPAAKAPEPVCGMNQAFLSGCLDGLRVNGVHAVLAPEPGECCVRPEPSDHDRDDRTTPDR
ncbi:helix-turn-helix domain-containing protein [Streptomyces sp. NPDC017936]|uniref:helix-turn-helix domain-containing protein n=1 Tax=Streptomyces sp. NPDC017936 TaxID=3365016 RepID=UPI0037B12956